MGRERADLARRLARLAEWRRADGRRRLPARGAWRVLCALAWRDTGVLAVFEAFTVPWRVAYGRRGAAEVRFPQDGGVERAFFCLYAGRLAEHEALDPDGSLTVMAYWAATTSAREMLRRILVDAGMLHVVRSLATIGTRHGVQDMPAEEITDLARLLAEHREWTQLWRLVCDVPVASAVAVMPLFDGWRPAGPEDAELFDELAAVGQDAVASVVARSARFVGERWSREVSFAPDVSEIAVADDRFITVLRLPDGQPVIRYPKQRLYRHLLHLGDRIVVHVGDAQDGRRVIRDSPDRPAEVLATNPYSPGIGLARTPSGFVIATTSGLRLGAATGPVGDEVRFDSLGLGTRWHGVLAGDPVAGRIAVVTYDGTHRLALLDANLELLARTTIDHVPQGIRACGTDVVLEWGEKRGSLRSWRRDGDTLVLAATESIDLPDQARWAQGVPISRDRTRLAWFEPATLEQVSGPPGFRLAEDPTPALSRHGDHTAVIRRAPDGEKSWHQVEVRDLRLSELVEMVHHPILTAPLAMLTVTAALAEHDLDEDAAALLRVLRACLKHRFGTEVALGEPTRPWPDDDIALGGG